MPIQDHTSPMALCGTTSSPWRAMLFVVLLSATATVATAAAGTGDPSPAGSDDHTAAEAAVDCCTQAANEYLSTTPEDMRLVLPRWLDEQLQSGPREDLVLLDCRPKGAFTAGHIAGSRHVDFREVAREETLSRIPDESLVVLVCTSGQSACMLNAVLNILGYRAVTLKGGINAWREAGYGLVEEADSAGDRP